MAKRLLYFLMKNTEFQFVALMARPLFQLGWPMFWKSLAKAQVQLLAQKCHNLGKNHLSGHSDLFVLESDEYGNKLQFLNPQAVLLNNIEYDHPDLFHSQEEYNQVFVDYLTRIPKKGFLVANFDDKNVRRLANVNCRGKSHFPTQLLKKLIM